MWQRPSLWQTDIVKPASLQLPQHMWQCPSLWQTDSPKPASLQLPQQLWQCQSLWQTDSPKPASLQLPQQMWQCPSLRQTDSLQPAGTSCLEKHLFVGSTNSSILRIPCVVVAILVRITSGRTAHWSWSAKPLRFLRTTTRVACLWHRDLRPWRERSCSSSIPTSARRAWRCDPTRTVCWSSWCAELSTSTTTVWAFSGSCLALCGSRWMKTFGRWRWLSCSCVAVRSRQFPS